MPKVTIERHACAIVSLEKRGFRHMAERPVVAILVIDGQGARPRRRLLMKKSVIAALFALGLTVPSVAFAASAAGADDWCCALCNLFQ